MKILWQELKKIVKQLLGWENMFGYNSTVANQLYLLYCFGGGKIYFTDKVHKRVKYFWYGMVSGQLLFSCVLGFTYLWYDEKNDLVLMLNVANSIGTFHMTTLGFTLVSYMYRDQIEAMIKCVDGLSDTKSSSSFDQNTVFEDAKKYFSFFLTSMIVCALVYLFACFADVLLFFEEEKVSNYFYYAISPPLVQKYSSFESFIMTTGITSFLFVHAMLEALSVFGLILYWNIICCAQLISIKNDLHAKTGDLKAYTDAEIKHSSECNSVYEYTLRRAIKELQNATRLIDYLREFVGAMGTLLITSAFCYGVLHLYVCFSNEMSLVLKVKCLSGYLITCIVVFLFYWIGQNVDNSVSEISLAVYSTPWYRLVKKRRTVCILLCQTQSTKNFAVFNVYTLLLSNFSRYLHNLVSYTNILRRLTNK